MERMVFLIGQDTNKSINNISDILQYQVDIVTLKCSILNKQDYSFDVAIIKDGRRRTNAILCEAPTYNGKFVNIKNTIVELIVKVPNRERYSVFIEKIDYVTYEDRTCILLTTKKNLRQLNLRDCRRYSFSADVEFAHFPRVEDDSFSGVFVDISLKGFQIWCKDDVPFDVQQGIYLEWVKKDTSRDINGKLNGVSYTCRAPGIILRKFQKEGNKGWFLAGKWNAENSSIQKTVSILMRNEVEFDRKKNKKN